MTRNEIDVPARERAYRESGWVDYDPASPAYTPEQVARERELYRN